MKRNRSVDIAGQSLVPIFLLLSIFGAWLALPGHVIAQKKAQPKSGPSPQPQTQPVATASPTPVLAIPLPQIVPRAEEVIRQLREMDERLTLDPSPSAIDQKLKSDENLIGEKRNELNELIAIPPILTELQDVEQGWLAQKGRYATMRKTLTERAVAVEEDARFLESQKAEWEATLNQIRDQKGIETVVERIREVLNEIQTTRSHANELLASLLALQDRVSQQNQVVLDALKKISRTKARLQRSLLDPDSPPLWKAASQNPSDQPFGALVRLSLGRNSVRTRDFLQAHRYAGLGILALFLGVLAIQIAFRRRILRWIAEHPDSSAPTYSFIRPFSLALLAVLMVMLPLMAALPAQVRMLVIMLFLVPVLRLLVPQIKPVFPGLLYVMIAYGLIASVWEVVVTSPGPRRWGLAVLNVAVIVTGVWLTRRARRRLQPSEKQARSVVVVVWVWLALILVSLIANVFGYVGLARVLRSGTVLSAYSAVMLYTIYLVTANVLSALFPLREADPTPTADSPAEILVRWTLRLMGWAGFFLWAYATLNVFTIREPLMSAISIALTTPIKLKAASFTFGDVLTFILVLAGGIGLAGLIRIILREAWLGRLNLKRGIPNAISTIAYYLLLLAVFLLALSAAGVELSKFTILTGAFGIGAGFGLQNVISNFVSGIILLFERPIRIGDFLEIDRAMGEVVRMGMRSSSIRTPQGAEVIVPNSNLISNQVMNWTLTEQQRRVEMRIKAAYGADPQKVSDLLTETALSHPDVLRQPKPAVFFQGFGDNSLDFEMQFWVSKTIVHAKVSSEIAMKIVREFQQAGIQIPAPRRELYVTGLAPSVKELLEAGEANQKSHLPGAIKLHRDTAANELHQ